MSLSRRYFLKSAAAVAAGAAVAPEFLCAQESKPGGSAAERIAVAVIGMGIRGAVHVDSTVGRDGVEILYLCDADLARAGSTQQQVEQGQGRAPEVIQDFRRALDNPRVDAVCIATPNHWHALQAILAMQAGKHVYVEKPASHNVWEGRQIVNWARKMNKVCQCGTQSRSSPSLQEAVKWVREGNLGNIQYAIGTCYNPRPSIGKVNAPISIPSSLDYDLWCGPAAKVDLYRPKLHYDWHWDFNTGNGDMGNQGIHQMDIARWFLGEEAISPRVMSIGARLGYEDAGNTPNTQIVYHGYEKAPLIFETRGLPHKDLNYQSGMDNLRGSQVGVIIQCEKGYVLVPSYFDATAHDPDGGVLKSWSGGGDHFANFFDAVRTGRAEDLNADILQGHLSSALCHTGAVSHQLGEQLTGTQIEQKVSGDPLWTDAYQRMAAHLSANGVDMNHALLSFGPSLEVNPLTERFHNNNQANQLLSRDYRSGFAVPEVSA
ncbi:Gfo/Idh/MocA family protein [Planctomicrobium sp. SH661]|uniref:Gfo/Idh/MocA family protein n=1 Tax=Planctomicrobium sp. SH661 TaxID=3448124 RepID=UPI003F5C47E9